MLAMPNRVLENFFNLNILKSPAITSSGALSFLSYLFDQFVQTS